MLRHLRHLIALAALALAFTLSSGARPALAIHDHQYWWSVNGRQYTTHVEAVTDHQELGHAYLTDNGDSTTTIEIVLDGNAPQAAQWGRDSLHDGTHDTYKPTPIVRLNDLIDGVSTTKITIPLTELSSKEHVIILEDSTGVVAFAAVHPR